MPCRECLGRSRAKVKAKNSCDYCSSTGVRPFTTKYKHMEKLIEYKLAKMLYIPLKTYLKDKESKSTLGESTITINKL